MECFTRRGFIVKGVKFAGIGFGAMTLGSALFKPGMAGAEEIRFPESSCGRETVHAPKILVTYASMYGSTGGIAETIGQTLCRNGVQVDVKHLKHVSEVNGYDAVVVGSAIRSSKWMPEALEFVEGQRKTLSEMPVAYFLSCLTLAQPNEKTQKWAEAFLDPLRKAVPEVKPVGVGLFAGVLDYGKMSFPVRMIMKQKMKQHGVGEGDYRSWDNIRNWASGLHPRLVKA